MDSKYCQMLSVDEIPPTDVTPFGAPAAPSSVSPQEAFAERAAKFALWSPFAGLLVLIVFMVSAGERKGELRLGIAASIVSVCWIIWAAGVVLGIMAFRRRKIAETRRILGRALIGMTLNSFFLGVTIWGAVFVAGMEMKRIRYQEEAAEHEAGKARAKVGNAEELEKKLVEYADRAFGAKVMELQKEYQTSWRLLTNPPVLDMDLVKSKDDLHAREEIIGDFITASMNLRDFSESVPGFYRQELLNHKLTPEAREASVKKFVDSLRGRNPTIVAMREADVRRGKVMLKMVTFLEENWGKWEFRPEANRLEFDGTKLVEDYRRVSKELDDITAETLRLEAKLKQLNATNF